TESTPSGVHILTVEGKEYDVAYAHEDAGHLAPSMDGSIIYTAGGRYTRDADPTKGKAVKAGGASSFSIPSPQADLFLSLAVNKQPGGNPKLPAAPVTGSATLHIGKSDRVLATLDDLVLPGNLSMSDRRSFAGVKRVVLLPQHNLLVTMPT